MYSVFSPATDHSSSGSPVFVECSYSMDRNETDWIEFAGVQSGIPENLRVRVIV